MGELRRTFGPMTENIANAGTPPYEQRLGGFFAFVAKAAGNDRSVAAPIEQAVVTRRRLGSAMLGIMKMGYDGSR